jgi:hypothetical protein
VRAVLPPISTYGLVASSLNGQWPQFQNRIIPDYSVLFLAIIISMRRHHDTNNQHKEVRCKIDICNASLERLTIENTINNSFRL